MFNKGDKVEHILSGDWLLVLEKGNLKMEGTDIKYLCRTKDLKEVWIYEWELKKINRRN